MADVLVDMPDRLPASNDPHQGKTRLRQVSCLDALLAMQMAGETSGRRRTLLVQTMSVAILVKLKLIKSGRPQLYTLSAGFRRTPVIPRSDLPSNNNPYIADSTDTAFYRSSSLVAAQEKVRQWNTVGCSFFSLVNKWEGGRVPLCDPSASRWDIPPKDDGGFCGHREEPPHVRCWRW